MMMTAMTLEVVEAKLPSLPVTRVCQRLMSETSPSIMVDNYRRSVKTDCCCRSSSTLRLVSTPPPLRACREYCFQFQLRRFLRRTPRHLLSQPVRSRSPSSRPTSLIVADCKVPCVHFRSLAVAHPEHAGPGGSPTRTATRSCRTRKRTFYFCLPWVGPRHRRRLCCCCSVMLIILH